ncbi:MAG TPA: GNAT family N-acetyltransferase [Verrucomicrobiae bacterium]|jgi:GNAT superfamily N-acetyltransferase|nr:GNAT family N-acetyltransferase [Verrucomicrobiae bacterium]
MPTIAITPITRAEAPILLELIHELATYEKLQQEVVATGDSLENALFGPRSVAGALIARCDGKIAGYAIYFFTFSSFVGREGIWLEDLYVRPAFRKRGAGRQLIEAVAKVGVDRNCERFEWTALDWNELALNFYDKLGAQKLDKWVLMRMKAKELLESGRAAK